MSAMVRKLALDLLQLALEELTDTDRERTLENQRQVLNDWAENFDAVPPQNRAEKLLYDALQAALDIVVQQLRLTKAS